MKQIFLIVILVGISFAGYAQDAGNAEIQDIINKAVISDDNSHGDTGKVKNLTPELVADIKKQFEESAKSECGANYKSSNEICGYDFDPVICGQDHGAVKVLKTDKQGDAYVAKVSLGGVKPNSYRLVKKDGKLMIDGISCDFDNNTSIKFNWK